MTSCLGSNLNSCSSQHCGSGDPNWQRGLLLLLLQGT